MYRLVITGGIASGKSTVSNYLKKQGYPVIDADQISRDLVAPGQEGLEAIRAHFGPAYLTPEGELDRAKLADKVFSDPQSQQLLNDLLHPIIAEKIQKEALDLERSGRDLIFLDIPLYYESKSSFPGDEVWLVYLDKDLQRARLQARNQIGPGQAQRLMDSQLPLEDKKKWVDFLIDNRYDLDRTYQQIEEGLQAVKKKIGKD